MFSSSVKSKSSSAEVKERNVIYFYQSLNGLRSCFVLPSKRYMEVEQTAKVCTISLHLAASRDDCPKGLIFENLTKDLRLMPDKTTYVSNFSDYSGLVFCNIFNTDGTPFSACPRSLLQSALGQLKGLGYELKVGFEIEFQILDAETLKPIKST